jgi:hypothetical protein
VVLLDLTLSINAQGNIETKTYFTPKNLHLYIPANLAHPSGCFIGTISGNVIRYWNQNSDNKDYAELISKFSSYLQAQ